jgi:DNA-binding response OmpR family regulator
MRTLVVEDDTAVVEALRESFQDSGLAIDYATDGESALKKIPEVDLLVTDLRLPGQSKPCVEEHGPISQNLLTRKS